MYTVESLQQKNLSELKEIGWQLNVLPEGDKRYRQNWIDALIGKNPPLLQLLEVPPAAQVEPAKEAIECPECQGDKFVPDDEGSYVECPACNGSGENEPASEAIEVQAQEPIESKFGRIVYPKSAKPITQTAKTTPGETDGNTAETDGSTTATLVRLCAPSHHPGIDTAELYGSSGGAESSNPQHTEGDQVLAAAGNGQRDKGRALRSQPNELAATFNDERPPNRGDGKGGRLESEPEVSQSAIASCASPVTFSPRFLATYPPYFGEIHYKAEATGQLNLLEPETDDEPPEPDDFASIDAFNEAMARWDAENAEALAVSMDSMCEWAPCPADWYEPEAEKMPLKASSMQELSPAESSSTFSIPTFDDWCDRANRQTDTDEPPDTGSFAKLPGPKPPKFPPRAIGQTQTNRASRNYPETIPKLFHCSAAAGSGQPGRAPPGGDVM